MDRRSAALGILLALIAPLALRAQVPPPPWEQKPQPTPLGRPLELPPGATPAPSTAEQLLVETPFDAPAGFTGRSSVRPSTTAGQGFIPVEDRWRIGMQAWDRYGNNHPRLDDYPFAEGNVGNPFKQNVLKGDYPIIGQHTFLNLTATNQSVFEFRQIPTATTPFEVTQRPNSEEFFGRPNQFITQEFIKLSFDLFHGDAAFKPVDWRVKLTPVFNLNYLGVQELAVVNPDVTRGLNRTRTFLALEEWFAEAKLADLSADYDFASVRVGSQFFVSDFRGFIFSDTNRAVRLFGTRFSNRDQFNVFFSDQAEKDTNSGLNTFSDRHQNVFVANYYRQDFVFPGYTAQASLHYNDDQPSFKFDKNNFLVRPDAAGVFQPHSVRTVYLGYAGDGHIDRYNISHAYYWVVGRDSMNPIGNTAQRVNSHMAAIEVSYDRDWARFRTSFFYAMGDGDVNDGVARGFDAIFDNPNFAGGEFSFLQRQNLPLFGVQLNNRGSLIPNLRSSKIQGQANHVNPGLLLFNTGVDFDISPRFRVINNANFLMFDKTNPLEVFLFDGNVKREIGTDLSTGFEYRPLLNNNAIIVGGFSTLIPARGFKNLYDRFRDTARPLVSAFLEVTLTY